jgi:polar amino acid transport system ATP-binding protein
MEDLAERGMTMVLVTHEMAFARRVAEQVVLMHKGEVWESGPTAQIFGIRRQPSSPSSSGPLFDWAAYRPVLATAVYIDLFRC